MYTRGVSKKLRQPKIIFFLRWVILVDRGVILQKDGKNRPTGGQKFSAGFLTPGCTPQGDVLGDIRF